MKTIQVDMFEVQLGAAILLQFETEGGTVRVLADAGVKASGYPREHVRDKLREMLGSRLRIDLIIGTHYDEDHLNGFVPIIEDADIEIGEAWMPPIADDTQSVAVDQPIELNSLLTHRLAAEGGRHVLTAYLGKKREDIEFVQRLEDKLGEASRRENIRRDKRSHSDGDQSPFEFQSREAVDLAFFRMHLTGDDHADHGCDQELEPHPLVERMIKKLKTGADPEIYLHIGRWGMDLDELAMIVGNSRPHRVDPQLRSLANLRRGFAKDAINASALHDVLKALRKKNVPVRTEVIDDGLPRRYRWSATDRRFVMTRNDYDGLAFDLLGPSKSLVKKHRDRLPVYEASQIALMFVGEIKSITPSNQLSYIGCFRHDRQSILITGDAGCVDFAVDRNHYHQHLLAALKSLNVVQVAHHGGRNAHFYRVLSAAGYPEQMEKSFLLLSHATHDTTRPSDIFHDFLLETWKLGDDVRLLFTSEPTRDKVSDYLEAIHPPVGMLGTVGDVRLHYDGEWRVDLHAILLK